MLIMSDLRTCEAGRAWSGSKPRCTEINCGRPDNTAFPNGWVEGSRTNLNSIITFRSDIRGERQLHSFLF